MTERSARSVRGLADRHWDALVIGAGPAGATAACSLARAGWSVLLVDRCEFPRPKVCGCCLAPGGVKVLEEVGLSSSIHDAGRVDRCTIRAGSASASIATPGYRVISRDVLDSRLASGARDAGATLLLGWTARVAEDGEVSLARAGNALASGFSNAHVRPRVVVVADGLGGLSLGDHSDFRWKVRRRSRMGVGALLSRSPVPIAAREVVMLCTSDGYLGVVRLPTGGVAAAAALNPPAVRQAGGPGQLCERIVAAYGGETGIVRDARWRGTALLTRRRRPVESQNIFVIGDAAGYVEPFTGEGMTWAIEGALLAARIIDEVLNGRASRGAWAAAQRRLLGMAHARCTILTWMTETPGLMRTVLYAAGRCPTIGRAAGAALGPVGARRRRSAGAPA